MFEFDGGCVCEEIRNLAERKGKNCKNEEGCYVNWMMFEKYIYLIFNFYYTAIENVGVGKLEKKWVIAEQGQVNRIQEEIEYTVVGNQSNQGDMQGFTETTPRISTDVQKMKQFIEDLILRQGKER